MVELLQKYLRILVFFFVAWFLLWIWNNTGCRKIEGKEMSPGIEKDDFKVVLSQKRLPKDLQADDVVCVEYERATLSQKSFAGRVFGKPGDLIWVERKFVSAQLQSDGLEVRRERPTKEEEGRWLPIIVPRGTYYVVCDNKRDFTLYDSRGVGPIGVWAVRGKLKN